MPELLKVSILGAGVSGEVWSVNPVFSTPTEPTLTFDQLNTIATAINALTVPSDLKNMIPASMSITGVRLEQRERDGELVSQLEQTRSTALVGTGTGGHPIQTAAVVSLISSFPGGRGRGRLYWPASGGSIDATSLRFSAGPLGAFLTTFKTYLSGIEDIITTTTTAADLVVWSRVGSAYHKVIKLRVGNVPDVQRRRRDALVEAYSSVDY